MYPDVLEEAGEQDIERPDHKQRQTSDDSMRKICAVMVSCHLSLQLDAYRFGPVGRNSAWPCSGSQIDVEATVTNMSLQVG